MHSPIICDKPLGRFGLILYHLLELLLTQCVDLSKRDRNGNTALHYACLASAESAALMLLERIEPELIDSPNAHLRTYISFFAIA